VAIELGAAYLAELSARYSGKPTPIIAAYNAGEAQVQLWQSYCYSFEPEELFTKVSFRETRAYLTRVLRSRSQYRAVYGDELP
jgi:soluble lytic murein transglycosylase